MKRTNVIALTAILLTVSIFGANAQKPGNVTDDVKPVVWLTPDGYNSTTGVWTNRIEGGASVGNFVKDKTAPTSTVGFNYHEGALFGSSGGDGVISLNHMRSEQKWTATGENVTFIIVYQRTDDTPFDVLFGLADGTSVGASTAGMIYYSGAQNTNDLYMRWATSETDLITSMSKGVLLTEHSNTNTNLSVNVRVSANLKAYTTAGRDITNAATYFTNKHIELGADGKGGYGFDGIIQEVIILRAGPGGTFFTNNSNNNWQKLSSYLAVKYSITMPDRDYLASDGTTHVWNRDADGGEYNNHIFGIARDEDYGLYQKQATSDSAVFSVYTGSNLAPLNSQNTGTLPNNVYALFGRSSAQPAAVHYPRAATDFTYGGGTFGAGDTMNYRTGKTYRMQLTGATSLSVNIALKGVRYEYCLVSKSESFAPGDTRIYKVTGGKTAIELTNEYPFIGFAGFEHTPGNTDITTITPIAWFTPDGYGNGVWTNRIEMPGTVGDFTQPATWTTKTPPATTVGSNFHPAVVFRPTGEKSVPNRMVSDNMIGVATDEAFTVIMVYRETANTSVEYSNVLSYSNNENNVNYQKYNITYSSSNGLYTSWGANGVTKLGDVPLGVTQLLTIDNNNIGANGIRYYLGGELKNTIASTVGSANTPGTGTGVDNYKIVIGGSHWELTNTGAHSFIGDVQELIILKRNKESLPFLTNINTSKEFYKIHSYLAVKYGVTAAHDYLASDGTTVWKQSENNDYSSVIFGIGRDDDYSLYQKQAATDKSVFNVYLGSSLTRLNSQNTGALDNKVYAIFGTGSAQPAIVPYTHNAADFALGGTLDAGDTLSYRAGRVHKVRVTGAETLTVNITPTKVRYEYCLVSSEANFPANQTRVYKVNNDGNMAITLPEGYGYIDFAGFADYSQGPGGVNGGKLRLWLRADDPSGLTLVHNDTPRDYSTAYSIAWQNRTDKFSSVQTTVSQWRDFVNVPNRGGRTGTVYDASSPAWYYRRNPVYLPSHPLTNYHPTIDFYTRRSVGDDSFYSALITPVNQTPVIKDKPVYSKILIMLNSAVDGNCYMMNFYNTDNGNNGDSYGNLKPGLGFSIVDGVVGLARLQGYYPYGSNAFVPGSTIMASYEFKNPPGNGAYMPLAYNLVGFNMNINTTSNSKGENSGGTLDNNNVTEWYMSKHNTIGGLASYEGTRALRGFISEVIMYADDNSTTYNNNTIPLTQDENDRIYSYYALKYGLTLRPNATAGTGYNGRFNYKLSNGSTIVWNGQIADASDKYAVFYNRLAAVVRDDASRLNNRQTHSTQPGSILHLGVAGSYLDYEGQSSTGELNNLEAVMFGDDHVFGITPVQPASCGEYERKFNRKWMLHKVRNGSVSLLFGLQNNSETNLAEAGNDYYTAIVEPNEFFMLVADSPADLDNEDFRAVVPMNWKNGEPQCAYMMNENDEFLYVTFGYILKNAGCQPLYGFDGTKTVSWSGWTSATSFYKDAGDGVTVNANVSGGVGYLSNSPASGSMYLELPRRTVAGNKATLTINVNTPVRAEFSISDIDAYWGRYERVTVTGYCDASPSPITPSLSYGSASSVFRIGKYPNPNNTAEVVVTGNRSDSDPRGRLNVAFNEGVKQIVIEFSLPYNSSSIGHILAISPLRFRQVPPPPPVNEDNLSFVKDVAERNITTCESAEYSFYIGNSNCEEKYVGFRDTLSSDMKWTDNTGMDVHNADNPHLSIDYSPDGTVLLIDSILVPGATTVRITAIATINDEAVPIETTRQFDNHAWIKYKQTVNDTPTDRTLRSVDRETHDDETTITAVGTVRQKTVLTKIAVDPKSYLAGDVITAVITVTNPNDPIDGTFLNINFSDNFTYIDNSLLSNIAGITPILPLESGSLSIAGNTGGSSGFILPNGESTFTFGLKAPAAANLEYELDEDGKPTEKIAALSIEYFFYTTSSDPCVIGGMIDVTGTAEVPYSVLTANNDYVSTIVGIPVVVPFLNNDITPSDCTPELTIIPQTSNGSASPEDNKILYTPAAGFVGPDSVKYKIACNPEESTAYIYIMVSKPLSQKYVACKSASVTMGFEDITGVEYYWYTSQTEGSPVSTGNTSTQVKDDSPVQTWWVEPQYKGVKFPRHKVELLLGDCGVTDPACTDGTILFKEDFGGNNTTDPERSSTPLGDGIVDYPFCGAASIPKECIQAEGHYALTKKSILHTTSVIWRNGYSDHTYPGDTTRGYMFLANAGAQPSKFYEYKINNLCPNTELYFSAWLANLCKDAYYGPQNPYLKFEITDSDNNVLAVYHTGKLPRTPDAEGLKWLQYGFVFNNADNSSVIMRISNEGAGGEGNDLVIDDIEILFCNTPVTTDYKDTLCVTNDFRTATVNVLKNDVPSNQVKLTGAEFVYPADAALASVTVNSTDSTVILTINPNAYLGADGHSFHIRYHVTDNGASQCETRTLTVRAYHVPDYSDIRIRICPDQGNVNLSKYLDTLSLEKITWESVSGISISDPLAGTISTADLKMSSTYTFTYTVDHHCAKNIKRKVYLETLKSGRMRPLKDSIVICYRYAEALQLNQLFGIEARGDFMFDAGGGDISSYISVSTSPTYNGATVMNGKAIYEDPLVGGAKRTPIIVTYTPANDSCLKGKAYSIKIILTDDIVN